jgi:hypothetical protein
MASPRFVSKHRKATRVANRRVVIGVKERGRLLYAKLQTTIRPRQKMRRSVVLHFADRTGKVRLFSAASSLKHLIPVSLPQLREWIKVVSRPTDGQIAPDPSPRTASDLPLSPKCAWTFEAIALERIEANDISSACEYLFRGCQLALRTPPTETLNLRLFDLLAGLAIRYGRTGEFVDPLINLLKKRIVELKRLESRAGIVSTSKVAQGVDYSVSRRRRNDLIKISYLDLEIRVDKWTKVESRWHRRWSDKKYPIWWHHPMENRSFSWKRRMSVKRSPPNPEKRQKPIKIT